MATDNAYVAAYIKNHKNFKELRIVEKIFDEDSGERVINSQIQKWCKMYGAHFISSSPGNKNLFKFSANIGPVLVIRDLEIPSIIFSDLLNIHNWEYSLGDLELF